MSCLGGMLGCLRPAHSAPLASHAIGSLRVRLPAVDAGSREEGLLAQIHYPADAAAPNFEGVQTVPWFRNEVIEKIASGYGLPRTVLKSLLAGVEQLDPPCQLQPSKSPDGWPMLVFSSGIWGSCEMYTQLCREVAAVGFIVIAIEHEDGSGIYAQRASNGEIISYSQPPPGKHADVSFRHPFLEKRADELDATTEAIFAAASGREVPSASPQQLALRQVLSGGNPSQLLLMGHSFGSTGVMRYLRRLRESNRSPRYSGVLLLDLWSGPLPAEDLAVLQIPFASLSSHSWFSSHGMERLQQVVAASEDRCLGAFEVRGTAHQWVSESHFFAPLWLLRKIGIAGAAKDCTKTFRATIQWLQIMSEAMLIRRPRDEVRSSLASIDPEILFSHL
eukprot:TRINITY_DN28109_c0_g2_i1.p1 TRINITY_DN28109_c0_g2~~TRINITY_DN28109_c0_g2_i1.p1  ORF type:complete len:391 (+),score=58.12 TRINITY_DN28109_c0_g2_i1:54-1226(+)